MSPALEYLRRLLQTRLDVMHAQALACGDGFRTAELVVPTPRLLLARAGAARYAVEGRTFRFAAGMLLWVPAGVKRGWHVPRDGRFSMAWVEYAAQGLGPAPRLEPYLLRRSADADLDAASLARLQDLATRGGAALQAEGELKALLARFFSGFGARVRRAGKESAIRRGGAGAQGIERAVAWLGEHFREPDALEGLPDRADLSANHFRLLFKRQTGLSAQRYLLTLRMRAARSFLQETDLAVKQVAQAVGYRDPLYFSRLYRGFWKRWPTEDRVFSP